ncbi:MAG: hypothetical protein HQL42_14100 [Alphaproteobacteria bacterium]|nr:hypothetical protein [Alphaproteobacteria bacterium]
MTRIELVSATIAFMLAVPASDRAAASDAFATESSLGASSVSAAQIETPETGSSVLTTPANISSFVRNFDKGAAHFAVGNGREIHARNQVVTVQGVLTNNQDVVSRGRVVADPAATADGGSALAITAGNGLNIKALDSKVIIDQTLVNRGAVISEHDFIGGAVDSHVSGNVVVYQGLRSQVIERINTINSGSVTSLDRLGGN